MDAASAFAKATAGETAERSLYPESLVIGVDLPFEERLPIKPPTPVPTPGSEKARYRGLWRFSVIVTSLVAIVPLLVLTVINYLNDHLTNSSH